MLINSFIFSATRTEQQCYINRNEKQNILKTLKVTLKNFTTSKRKNSVKSHFKICFQAITKKSFAFLRQ